MLMYNVFKLQSAFYNLGLRLLIYLIFIVLSSIFNLN